MFHDGDCPLCNREVALLRRLDSAGRIKFTDIAAPDFDPLAYGKDLGMLMAEIHARRSDGSWIRGVEVFRQLYSAVGFGCLVNLSRLPVLSQFIGLGYWVFAKNRLRLTGRCDADGSSCRACSRARATSHSSS
jgi:predicted DCC family thiol-disulfide oxidoreductase YuxK